MSNSPEERSEAPDSEAIAEWVAGYYHYVILGILAGFIVWNRARNWSNFVVDGEIFFRGNDAWYHYRMTEYTAQNFPSRMVFDPWTYFPFGSSTEQFGTIFDQIIALVALVVGLGSPDSQTIAYVFLFSPVGFALAAIVPGYLISRRLGNRVGGLIGVAVIALAADRLLSVTLAGNTQHEAAEPVFMSLGVLGIMVALTVAEKEKPVYELLAAREFDALRRPIGWSMLAGIAITVYVWTWPPGMWLYGILAIFFVIHLSIEHLRRRSPEHAAFVGVATLLTAAVLQLSSVRSLAIDPTSSSLLQPGFAIATAVGIVYLAWLSRMVDASDQPVYVYPVAVAVSIVASALAMFLLTPDLFDFLLSQTDRVLGFVTSPGTAAGTIGEATPMEPGRLFEFYKLAIVSAIGGIGVILFRQFYAEDSRGEELLVVVWFVFVVLASLTQVRFAYYLTIPVAALNAALVGAVMDLVRSDEDTLSLETYEILTVATVILFVIVPMAVVAPSPVAAAAGGSFPGDSVAWDDNLEWMEENTPEPGQYGNPDNEPMPYYDDFAQTNDYEYPEGSYGVISWWDYGHWITVEAERIPTANPFQQGSDTAADFLLAQDEEESFERLSAVDESEDIQTQYVMIDWLMVETESGVGGKFFAPPDFHDNFSRPDFYTRLAETGQRGRINPVGIVHKQRYYDSMVARLYHYHGSAQNPQPFVVQWQGQEQQFQGIADTFVQTPQQQPVVRFFQDVDAAEEYAANNTSTQVGGIGPYPSERVSALEHYRLVYMNEVSVLPRTEAQASAVRPAVQSGANFNRRQVLQRDAQRLMNAARSPFENQNRAIAYLTPNTPSFTKTFERVPGATIEGEAPANQELALSVQMEPENGRQFVYTQYVQTDDDGQFNTTVPYSTEGYDEWGVEQGYTNVSVRANTSYEVTLVDENGQFIPTRTTFDVTEGQVVGEDDSAVTVSVDESDIPDGAGSSNGGTTDGETTDGTTDGETTDGGSTDGGSTDNETASSLELPAGVESALGTSRTP